MIVIQRDSLDEMKLLGIYTLCYLLLAGVGINGEIATDQPENNTPISGANDGAGHAGTGRTLESSPHANQGAAEENADYHQQPYDHHGDNQPDYHSQYYPAGPNYAHNPYVPLDQQYYYDPSYYQQHYAPPYGQQNYPPAPEQYHYDQPAINPNYPGGYYDPRYGQQQQYDQHHQGQPNQGIHETPTDAAQQTQSSIAAAPESTQQATSTSRKKKSKSTKAKAKTTATTTTVASSTFSVEDVPSHALDQWPESPVPPFPHTHPNSSLLDPNHLGPSYDPQLDAQYHPQPPPHGQFHQPQQSFSYPPQGWDPNVHPGFQQQDQNNYWYPGNHPNDPDAWQPADPNQNWPPINNQYQQPGQQHQPNIDWQVFDLYYDGAPPFDLTPHPILPSQTKQLWTRYTTMARPETTEKNYNTFGPQELRDLTSTVNDSVNYNTYSDQEWRAIQGVTKEPRNETEEYAEYDTAELLENDSDETRDYNTHEPTNATTEPAGDIDFNTFAPEELQSAHQPGDVNFNTHGNRPYYHTDPNSLERRYREYPATRNASARPSYHTPLARLHNYYATAQPPAFERMSTFTNFTNVSTTTEIPGLLDVVVSLTTSTIGRETYYDQLGHENEKEEPESFLDRWIFARKRTTQPVSRSSLATESASSPSAGTSQIPSLLDLVVTPIFDSTTNDDNEHTPSKSFLNRLFFDWKSAKTTRASYTFDPRSRFGAPSTSDHWLLSNHHTPVTEMIPSASKNRIKATTIDYDYDSLPWYPPLSPHSSPADGLADVTGPHLTPTTPSNTDAHSPKFENLMRDHRPRPNHHIDDHDQIVVEGTVPMNYHSRDFSSTQSPDGTMKRKRTYKPRGTKSELHLNGSNRAPRKRASNSTRKKASVRPKREAGSYASDVSSSSEESLSAENRSNPLDVSNAKDYCAWADHQRYLLSIERKAAEDRKHQKISRPPILEGLQFRSIKPEYMQTPYWTGSTSYVYLEEGKKKKVIDLPDEPYGLLIEDSEEWWAAQKREAKRLRAWKYLGLNRDGYRRSRLRAQEEEKASKFGRLCKFVKKIFRKITGCGKDDEPKLPQPEHDGRSWDRNDERNPNYRQHRNNPNDNYPYNQNAPPYRYLNDPDNIPDPNYRHRKGDYDDTPTSPASSDTYLRDWNTKNQQGNRCNDRRNYNGRFMNKPFQRRENSDDRPKPKHKIYYRQEANTAKADNLQDESASTSRSYFWRIETRASRRTNR